MKYSIALISIVLMFFGSCKKVAKEIVVHTPTKSAVKPVKDGIQNNLSKAASFTNSKDLMSHHGFKPNMAKNLKSLDKEQLKNLSFELEKNVNLKDFISKDPTHITAYKKLHMNPTLRQDVGYLQEVATQIKRNPTATPVINIRRNAVNNTSFDVPIVKKTFKSKDVVVEGYFPDFKKQTVFSAKLPKDQYFNNDIKQFSSAKAKLMQLPASEKSNLRKKLAQVNGSSEYDHPDFDYRIKGEQLVDIQIKDINDPKKSSIFGLTWHHNEAEGVLDLVNYEAHKKIPHTGGRALWGGSTEHR